MLWSNGSVPSFFGKDGSCVLANCFLYGTEATLSFSAGPVCQSFSAKACVVLLALLVSAAPTSLPLLFFSSRHLVLSSIFPLTSMSVATSVFSPSVLSGCNESPDTRFSRGTTGWLDGERYSCPLQSLVVAPLIFSDWRRTVSSKFFDTQVPSISTEKLMLPRHACCVLSCLRCNGRSLLFSSYLSRIDRIENSSCSACGHLSSHSALCSY